MHGLVKFLETSCMGSLRRSWPSSYYKTCNLMMIQIQSTLESLQPCTGWPWIV